MFLSDLITRQVSVDTPTHLNTLQCLNVVFLVSVTYLKIAFWSEGSLNFISLATSGFDSARADSNTNQHVLLLVVPKGVRPLLLLNLSRLQKWLPFTSR